MKENEDNQATDGFLEFAGRKFPDTPEGRAQLKGYGEALSQLVGRQSNEVGEARKKLSKYQRIEATLPEPVKALLNSDSASEDAKLLAQYMYQDALKRAGAEDSSRQSEWYAQATSMVLEELPELQETLDADLVDAFLRKHSIHEAEDPLGEAKRLLSAKKKKAKSQSEPSDHISVDASSPRSTKSNSTKENAKDIDINKAFFSAIGATE